MNKKGQSGRLLFGAVIFLVVLIGIGCGHLIINGWHYETGSGEHTGTITAVELDGLVWKTYSIYFKTDTQSSQEDHYCVMDDSLIPKLKELSQSKAKVTISYVDYFLFGEKYCGDSEIAVVTGVK